MTDIEIAHKCALKNISEIAEAAGIDEAYVEPYGRHKAKVSLDLLREKAAAPDGKLILVTAITPTPAGEGKTTTSIGLTDALRRCGKTRSPRCASRRWGRCSASRAARPAAAMPRSSRWRT